MTDEFNQVFLLMQEPLPDEPEALVLSLENIEVWNSRMQFLLAEVESRLNKQNIRALPGEGTELYRKMSVKFLTADLQEERDKLESICDAIKTRITLGQSILKYYSTTQNIQYKENKHPTTSGNQSLSQILGD